MPKLTRSLHACAAVLVVARLLVTPAPLSATSFNLTFDASTANAPAAFFTAFDDAVQLYEAAYSDPITINLQVGWGKIGGNNLNPGELGQSSTVQQGIYSYAAVRTALTNDATSAADAQALSQLLASDPTHGASFVMSNAEAKALGLLGGNASGLDGFVGFNNLASYTFDPQNRAAAGKYDFIGLASHELSEIMGRYGLSQNGAPVGLYSPIDLFRYSSPGVLDLTPADGAYFSIDGGNTAINTFNGTGGGDLSDWAGLTPDSYNAFLTAGEELDVTPGDFTVMDVLGYDPATSAVPEPTSAGLLGCACAVLVVVARKKAGRQR